MCIRDRPQTNLIDIIGQGWQDASSAVVTGVPLCPLFYSGNWAIRACGEDVTGPQNPLQVDVAGSPAPPGAAVNLTLNAPGLAGFPYVMGASFGTSPGIPVTSGSPPTMGTVPLNTDGLFFLSLSTPGTFINFTGTIGGGGTANAVILVPNNPSLSGLSFSVAFIVIPPFPNAFQISDAAAVAVL